ADPGDRPRILAIMFPDFLLTPGNLAGTLDNGAGDLVLGHRDVVLLADFRKHEPEPHAPFGYGAILVPRLLLGRALVGEAAALRLEIAFDRAPDVLELVLGERRRQR